MTPSTSNNLQAEFLDQVKSRLPDKVSFVDTLASLLEISRDSAYRRLRGETVLSLDEAKKLCDLFGISLDAHFSSAANSSLFHHRALSTTYTMDRWLNSVVKNFTFFNSFEQKEMIFAARDMPLFQHFRLPELTAFKLFVWLKTVIKDPAYTNRTFDFNVLSEETMKAAKKIWQLYSTIPTIEIWSDEAIHETLKQIEFYHECRFFSDEQQPRFLCDKLLDLIGMVKEDARQGKKMNGASYQLFENEILIANNTIYARMDKIRYVYINYNTLSLLTTQQSSFCDKTVSYLENLRKNSVLISTTAEKERNKFFNRMKDRVEEAKARLT